MKIAGTEGSWPKIVRRHARAVVLNSAFLGLSALVAACASGAKKAAVSSPSSAANETVSEMAKDPKVELAEALALYAAAPTDPEATFRLGLARQAAGEPDSAKVVFERLLTQDPDNVKALVHHGLVLEELNQHAQAETEYRRAIELKPDDPLPYINLGSLLYFHSKKTYEAKVAFSKALELDPNSADARFNLGVLFADANLYREAEVEWKKVLELKKEGPAATLARENLERIRPLLQPADSSTSAP